MSTTVATGNPRELARAGRKNKPDPLGTLGRWALSASGFVVFLGLWQLVGMLELVDEFFISSPAAVLEVLLTWGKNGVIVENLWATTAEAGLGLIIGIVLGVLLAFALHANRWLDRALFPMLAVLIGMPRIVFAPLFILWFGIGMSSKVALAVTVVSLIVFFATYAGLQQTDVGLTNKVRILGGSPAQVRRHVLLPSVVVWVMSSMRTSIGMALAAAVVGEYLGSLHGIGYLIARAQGMLDVAGIYAGVTLLAVVLVVIDVPLRRVELYFTRWQPKQANNK